jgi:hypothetical protein
MDEEDRAMPFAITEEEEIPDSESSGEDGADTSSVDDGS